MNIFDGLEELVAAVINQLGLFVQVPGFILGVVLLVLAYVMVSRAGSDSGVFPRVIAGIALTLGLPILLASIGVGATDALLWGILALLACGIWLAAAKGKLITLIGVVVAVLAIGAIVNVTQSNPSGSVIADSVRSVLSQMGIIWDAITA